MPSRSSLLGPLSLAMGVSTVGVSMLSTGVPLYAVALGATPLWVGAIVALPSLLPALLGVSAGRWVDRSGPARWLAIGTIGTASAPLLLTLLPGMTALAVAQLVLGTFQLFATVAAQSLVARLGREGSMARDYARFTTSISLGRLVGPALVGVAIDLAGFRPAFAVAAAFGTLAAGVAFRVRAEVVRTEPAPARATGRQEPASGPALLGNVGLQVAVAASAGLFVALSVRQAFLPVALEAYGFSATAIGTLISVGAAATVAVRPAMPWVSRTLGGAARALVVAMAFVAVGVGLLGLATSTAAVALLLVAAGVGTGVGLPSSIVMVAEHVGPDRRGAALGLRLSLNRAAQLVAPVAVGALVSTAGFAAGFGVAGVAVAMSAWMVARRSGAWAESSAARPPASSAPTAAAPAFASAGGDAAVGYDEDPHRCESEGGTVSKPEPYVRLQRENPELVEAYERFASVAHESGPLSDRERRLIKLAIAVASGSEGATHSHARQALSAGIDAADLRHVAFLIASTMGFPTMMRALSWIEDVTEPE